MYPQPTAVSWGPPPPRSYSTGLPSAVGSTSGSSPLPSQVQGAEEANKERQRQKELETNYRRVWGSPGGEDTGDLEELDF